MFSSGIYISWLFLRFHLLFCLVYTLNFAKQWQWRPILFDFLKYLGWKKFLLQSAKFSPRKKMAESIKEGI